MRKKGAISTEAIVAAVIAALILAILVFIAIKYAPIAIEKVANALPS